MVAVADEGDVCSGIRLCAWESKAGLTIRKRGVIRSAMFPALPAAPGKNGRLDLGQRGPGGLFNNGY